MPGKHKCEHTNRPIFSHGLCEPCARVGYLRKAQDKANGISKSQSIDIGDEVITEPHHRRGIVTRIEDGLYYLNTDKGGYELVELRKVDATSAKFSKPQINKVSAKKKELDKVYNFIQMEYLRKHNTCQALLDGCTIRATEIHHKYGRDGYYLIQSEYFLPICASCHGFITENSEQAIELGMSLIRTIARPNIFTERELELMEQFKIKLP